MSSPSLLPFIGLLVVGFVIAGRSLVNAMDADDSSNVSVPPPLNESQEEVPTAPTTSSREQEQQQQQQHESETSASSTSGRMQDAPTAPPNVERASLAASTVNASTTVHEGNPGADTGIGATTELVANGLAWEGAYHDGHDARYPPESDVAPKHPREDERSAHNQPLLVSAGEGKQDADADAASGAMAALALEVPVTRAGLNEHAPAAEHAVVTDDAALASAEQTANKEEKAPVERVQASATDQASSAEQTGVTVNPALTSAEQTANKEEEAPVEPVQAGATDQASSAEQTGVTVNSELASAEHTASKEEEAPVEPVQAGATDQASSAEQTVATVGAVQSGPAPVPVPSTGHAASTEQAQPVEPVLAGAAVQASSSEQAVISTEPGPVPVPPAEHTASKEEAQRVEPVPVGAADKAASAEQTAVTDDAPFASAEQTASKEGLSAVEPLSARAADQESSTEQAAVTDDAALASAPHTGSTEEARPIASELVPASAADQASSAVHAVVTAEVALPAGPVTANAENDDESSKDDARRVSDEAAARKRTQKQDQTVHQRAPQLSDKSFGWRGLFGTVTVALMLALLAVVVQYFRPKETQETFKNELVTPALDPVSRDVLPDGYIQEAAMACRAFIDRLATTAATVEVMSEMCDTPPGAEGTPLPGSSECGVAAASVCELLLLGIACGHAGRPAEAARFLTLVTVDTKATVSHVAPPPLMTNDAPVIDEDAVLLLLVHLRAAEALALANQLRVYENRVVFDAARSPSDLASAVADCIRLHSSALELLETRKDDNLLGQQDLLRWWSAAARQGSSGAAIALGNCFYYGNCTEIAVAQDVAEAERWYRCAVTCGPQTAARPLTATMHLARFLDRRALGRASSPAFTEAVHLYTELSENAGDADYAGRAAYNLAKLYERVGSDNLALLWYQKARSHNVPDAFAGEGALYCHGRGVSVNNITAQQLFHQGIQLGSVRAIYGLGMCCTDGGICADGDIRPPGDALAHKAASLGDPDALAEICFLEPDAPATKTTMSRCVSAAEAGVAEAAAAVANIFHHGRVRAVQHANDLHSYCTVQAQQPILDNAEDTTVPVNRANAVTWYRRAAFDVPTAALVLGYYSSHGLGGLSKSASEAARWYREAADGGERLAMALLGEFYERDSDLKEARRWYDLAGGKIDGDALAQYNIGNIYFRTERYADAYQWYDKSASNGFGIAANMAGILYIRGLGVSRNDKLAKNYFELAASQGYPPAMKNLADCFYCGSGAGQNAELAKSWYMQAKECGLKCSIISKKECSSIGKLAISSHDYEDTPKPIAK